jgi:glycosyltransferase involved in cell wall biosynthesis
MNIAVCTGSLRDTDTENNRDFVTDVLTHLAKQMQDHRFLIISDSHSENLFSFNSNIVIINLGTPLKRGLLRKYWWEIKLPRILKKIKADVLISFDGLCSKSSSLPQVLVLSGEEQTTHRTLKKAKIIAVISQWHKRELVKKYKMAEEKTEVVSAAVSEIYKPISEDEKEKVKAKYCDGKEYFLCPGQQLNGETFITLLKSFSYFKKRQQSSMKLLLLAKPDGKSIKSLSTYKYRNDLILHEKASVIEEASLMGSSYAVLILPNNSQPVLNTLKAMQCGVPVITSENPVVNEIAGEAALYAENVTATGIGEKIIRIYTDENLRNQLIKKGEIAAGNFSIQKTADLLANFISKAVK